MISEAAGQLGRGVVVLTGQEPPEVWASCPRVLIGDASLSDPGPAVEDLHRYWIDRRPVVVVLDLDPTALRAPERCDRPVYELRPDFEFSRERLQFLVWANNYDARGGEPVWWHGRKAARQFAHGGVVEGGPADVTLADGSPLFIDGGPPHPPSLSSAIRSADRSASPPAIGVVHRWNAEAGRLEPAGHAPPSSELAPDQLAAVGHRTGAARVIAPAGSGKTRVLTERLRHLIVDRRVHPSTITALAYNNKAAADLRLRCEDIPGAPALNIRTLNSLGFWICNEFGPAGRRRVLEEGAVRDLLQRHIEIRRQSNTDTVAPYLEALSAIRLGLTPPSVVEEAIPDAAGIAEGFAIYRSALADLGAVDFDEQIYQAIEILLTDADARVRAQSSCRHLLVDEFQDLNPAHLLLIRLLAAPSFDCFGVGDDDQVIYGYAGATPEFLIEFPRYFPGASGHAPDRELPVPARPHRRGAPRALVQRAPSGQRDPRSRRAYRRAGPTRPLRGATEGLRAGRGVEDLGRRAGRPGRGRHFGLALGRSRPRRYRRPDPGQFGPPAGASGLHGSRGALHHSPVAERAATHRHPHRLRLPAHRIRPGPHQAGGRPRDDPPPLPRHRPQGRRHAHQPTHHLDQRHTTTGRAPLGPRRTETRGLRRRPRDRRRGLRPFGGGGPQDHPARDRAGRHHGHPRCFAGRGRSLDPCR